MTDDRERPPAGDAIPGDCELIEVRVGELKQLFNLIDPSPFREKDLDPGAEEFIVSWAREGRRHASFALRVHVDGPAGPPEEAATLREAVQEYFRARAKATRSRLRLLFSVGRTSLAIGVVCLALSIGFGTAVERLVGGARLGELLRESLMIGGWVAMWRPLETFLYDWWPIRAEARLFDKLSAMPVHVAYAKAGDPKAGRDTIPA